MHENVDRTETIRNDGRPCPCGRVSVVTIRQAATVNIVRNRGMAPIRSSSAMRSRRADGRRTGSASSGPADSGGVTGDASTRYFTCFPFRLTVTPSEATK